VLFRSSASPHQPAVYPYYLEGGTPNTVGIAGLAAGLDYLDEHPLDSILAHEQNHVRMIIDKLDDDDRFTIFGSRDATKRVGTVSFNIQGYEPSDIGAILDPLGNAVHTALSFDLVGEDVLITGAGPIGIMAAAVARHVGARHVVITDINQTRLDLAARVVDVVPVNVAEQDLKQVEDGLKMAQGFDVGLEMSGSQAALDQMIEALVMGGRIALLGIPPGKSPVDWSRIVFKAITIKGVYGREIFETWYKMIAMLQNGLDVSGVITHHFGVDDFEQGFAVMKSGLSGKEIGRASCRERV